jgi:hypothetical protein
MNVVDFGVGAINQYQTHTISHKYLPAALPENRGDNYVVNPTRSIPYGSAEVIVEPP